MTPLLFAAVILFTLALVFYTWGVWAEKLARRLKLWHIKIFACGVFVDILATGLTIIEVGAVVLTPHAIIGFTSLGLMVLHFGWAIRTIRRANELALQNFHKLSLFVWSIWMISYITGFVSGLGKM